MAEQWIQKATSKNRGALRKKLGAKPGKAIPEKKLEKAAGSKNPRLAKEARLAETLKKLRKK